MFASHCRPELSCFWLPLALRRPIAALATENWIKGKAASQDLTGHWKRFCCDIAGNNKAPIRTLSGTKLLEPTTALQQFRALVFTVRLSLEGEVQTVQSHHQVQAIFEWLEKLFDASSARAKNDSNHLSTSKFCIANMLVNPRGCSQKGLTQCVNLTKGPFKLVWA